MQHVSHKTIIGGDPTRKQYLAYKGKTIKFLVTFVDNMPRKLTLYLDILNVNM